MKIENLNWRYATNLFDNTKKVSEEDLNELLEVLRLTPSSFGLEPWKFVVVKNDELKQKIKPLAYNQPQIESCSHLIILCARTDVDEAYISKFIHKLSAARGVDVHHLGKYESTINAVVGKMNSDVRIKWAEKQVYLAAGFLMFAAAQKKIDCCPMEGFNMKGVDELLNLQDENLASMLLLPIGYRSIDDKYASYKKVRNNIDEVIIRK